MNSKRLNELWGTMSRVEQNRFRKYLQSPYLNANPAMLDLFDFLSEGNEDMRRWHTALYPGKVFRRTRIDNLISDFCRHAEQFMVMESQEEVPAPDLLEALRNRKAGYNYKLHLRRAEKAQSEAQPADPEAWLQRYRIIFEGDQHRLRSSARKAEHAIDARIEALDIFYLMSSLRDHCERANRANIVHAEAESALPATSVKLLEANPDAYMGFRFIRAYYLCYKCLTAADPYTWFPILTGFLEAEGEHLPPRELQACYGYAQNVCIRQINRGFTSYLSSLFRLYQTSLSRGLLTMEGEISQADFKNIVALGLRLQELDWTERFIHDYHQLLSPDIRREALEYNMASLHYARGDFGAAKRLLRTLNFEDVYFQLGARSLLLKIYYEDGDDDALDFLLRAFAAFLKRNKEISQYQRRVHQNLVRFTKKAWKLRARALPAAARTAAVQKLKAEITEAREVTNMSWLLGVLE